MERRVTQVREAGFRIIILPSPKGLEVALGGII